LRCGPLGINLAHVAYPAAGEAARHDRALHPDPSAQASGCPRWIHEIKHDDYRLIARKRDGRVCLFTRNGFDWSNRYPRISETVAALGTASATIDGEAVWCAGEGLAIFERLHSKDWQPGTLEERKGRLAELLANAPPGIQYNEHLEGDGAAIFAHACKLGAEGIVSKHREHPYRSGPSKAWLKTKNPAAPGMLRFRDEPGAAGVGIAVAKSDGTQLGQALIAKLPLLTEIGLHRTISRSDSVK
jgi:bifunctional non-homologous end joining protein LigD